jgi:formylmethanofuran dehydrogenase subunit E
MMVKFPNDFYMRLDEIVQCKDCGKQMRREERIIGFKEIVCRKCAEKRKQRSKYGA